MPGRSVARVLAGNRVVSPIGNGTIAELGDKTAGCLIGYALESDPEASEYESMPPMFVPLQQLEDLAPDT